MPEKSRSAERNQPVTDRLAIFSCVQQRVVRTCAVLLEMRSRPSDLSIQHKHTRKNKNKTLRVLPLVHEYADTVRIGRKFSDGIPLLKA